MKIERITTQSWQDMEAYRGWVAKSRLGHRSGVGTWANTSSGFGPRPACMPTSWCCPSLS